MAEDSEHNVDVKKCYCYSFTFGNCTGKNPNGETSGMDKRGGN